MPDAPHWPADGSGDEFDGGYDPTVTTEGGDPSATASVSGAPQLDASGLSSQKPAEFSTERIADDNGDELEHGGPDFPGQFPEQPVADTEGPCNQCGGGDGLGHTPDCPAVAGDRSDIGDALRGLAQP